jgi:hypothetical protein
MDGPASRHVFPGDLEYGRGLSSFIASGRLKLPWPDQARPTGHFATDPSQLIP